MTGERGERERKGKEASWMEGERQRGGQRVEEDGTGRRVEGQEGMGSAGEEQGRGITDGEKRDGREKIRGRKGKESKLDGGRGTARW